MVICMELWFLADKDGLKKFFGTGFNAGRLLQTTSLESIDKIILYDGLKKATKNTNKGEYGKGQYSFKILICLDARKMENYGEYSKEFFEYLRNYRKVSVQNNILLENLNSINNKESKEMLPTFLNLYLQNAFQSISKKDIDLLLFYLIDEHTVFKGKDNYEKAKHLKITHTKLKLLQLESHMKGSDKTSKHILKSLFERVLKKENIKRLIQEQKNLLSKDEIPIVVKNPIEKLELEKLFKDNYSIIKYERNSEVIKVNLQIFVSLAIYIEEDQKKLLNQLRVFDDVEKLKGLLIKKDISKLKISDLRYILNELTYEMIKIIASKIIENISSILSGIVK